MAGCLLLPFELQGTAVNTASVRRLLSQSVGNSLSHCWTKGSTQSVGISCGKRCLIVSFSPQDYFSKDNTECMERGWIHMSPSVIWVWTGLWEWTRMQRFDHSLKAFFKLELTCALFQWQNTIQCGHCQDLKFKSATLQQNFERERER